MLELPYIPVCELAVLLGIRFFRYTEVGLKLRICERVDEPGFEAKLAEVETWVVDDDSGIGDSDSDSESDCSACTEAYSTLH